MVASYLGIKQPPNAPPPSADDPSGIGGLMARFPSGVVPADR